MADSLGSILGGRGLNEPPEIRVIKNFIMENFGTDVKVRVGPKQILIIVDSSALAGSLRLSLHKLSEACQTNKRLVIRVGG